MTGDEKEAPTIELKVYEGPLYSEEDNVCYYRIEAIVTGNPSPKVEFSRDDSQRAWGPKKCQVNLYGADDTYKLIASAINSEGSATDYIELYWECELEEEIEITDLNTLNLEESIQEKISV